ncbi:hypothetical protein FNV43_RR07443 [Rhamnella rubrinervis]|uniref:Uncharacterized protein n=1 Tax=Rhamnella rubrinervis TaxID=2594499 RepID=A0A8K0HGM4_9ROSA|nr:hypothetical protein FNV43_RR07443 [Rhamnella rubrinervis]
MGEKNQSPIEYIHYFTIQYGEAVGDDLPKLKLFSNFLTSLAFTWFINLPINSIHTWLEMERKFHEQFYKIKLQVYVKGLIDDTINSREKLYLLYRLCHPNAAATIGCRRRAGGGSWAVGLLVLARVPQTSWRLELLVDNPELWSALIRAHRGRIVTSFAFRVFVGFANSAGLEQSFSEKGAPVVVGVVFVAACKPLLIVIKLAGISGFGGLHFLSLFVVVRSGLVGNLHLVCKPKQIVVVVISNWDWILYSLLWLTWEIGGIQPSVTANKLGLDLGTGLNVGKQLILGVLNLIGNGNYGHYARVLIDVDLVVFVPKKLLLEMTDDCTSCHSVDHYVAEGKSLFEKVSLQPIKSTTPSVPTINAFEVLNTEVPPAHIEDMVHQHDAAPSSMTNKMGIEIRSSALDIGATATKTDINTETGDKPEDNNYADDFGEDEWPPLQGVGSSKLSNEFDDTPYMGQQSNTMAMVPFKSFGALTAAHRKLDLVTSQPNVS